MRFVRESATGRRISRDDETPFIRVLKTSISVPKSLGAGEGVGDVAWIRFEQSFYIRSHVFG